MRKRSSLLAIKYGRSVFERCLQAEKSERGKVPPCTVLGEKLFCVDPSPHPEVRSGIPVPLCIVLVPACEHREREGAFLACTSTCKYVFIHIYPLRTHTHTLYTYT